MLKDNPDNYECDSHTSIAHFFKIDDDKVDKFELNFRDMLIKLDVENTENYEENSKILQDWVNTKSQKFWLDLIMHSNVVRLDNDVQSWMLTDGVFNLPNATYVHYSDNEQYN